MTTPLHPAEILVVDDVQQDAKLLAIILEAEGFMVRTASSGNEALKAIEIKAPDLILLDIMMPGMDGFAVARKIKRNKATTHIPVILVSALTDHDSFLKGLESGAEEYVTKPVDRAELKMRVRNLLHLKEGRDFLDNHNRLLEHQVKLRTVQLAESYRETLYLLARAAEYRDETTVGHINRISDYCRGLAQAMGQDKEFQDRILYASPLHDIGKIGIPDSILLKRGALSPHEWTMMKTHTTLGADLLSEGRSDYLRMAADIALCHHECWDGSGYPQGLRGEEIPLAARIMALCDAYDALRSERPFKEAYTHERAMDALTKGDRRTRPEHFDPDVMDVFVCHDHYFAEIYKHLNEDDPKSALILKKSGPQLLSPMRGWQGQE
jgi:putative two-component system response regulator